MVIQIPAPETLLQITWTIIGFMLARSFKQIDHNLKETDWFKSLTALNQYLTGAFLDFFHHFEIGLVLMVYFSHIPEFYWFGYGLFLDDLPDLPPRFKKWFDYIGR